MTMINYNMRYRGPYEYEKFLLNILQHHNAMNNFLNESDSEDTYQTLKALSDEVNKVFNDYTGSKGMCESIYHRLVLFKEAE